MTLSDWGRVHKGLPARAAPGLERITGRVLGALNDLDPHPGLAHRAALQAGDLLLATYTLPLRAAVVPTTLIGRTADENLHVICPHPPGGDRPELSSDYVCCYLRSHLTQLALAPHYRTVHGTPCLSSEALKTLTIPVIAPGKQRALVALKKAHDDLKQAALEELKARSDYIELIFSRSLEE